MPKRLSEEEKARREAEKERKKAETAKKRSETMKERHKTKEEEVKKLKTDLEVCHNRVEQLTHPKMLPVHTIEALRRVEEETMKRNIARMKKPELIVMKRIDINKDIREENARRREMEAEKRNTAPVNTFKKIFLDFLKNVENGEPAIHKNNELRYSDEKYHEWRSTKSYPIFSTDDVDRPFIELEAPYDPSKPNTSGKSQYRIELGWDSPSIPPERVADKDVLPLTDVRVLIVGFNNVIGNMSEKEALKETIRVLERTPVSLPERYAKNTFYGKNYTKEAIKSYFDERIKEEHERYMNNRDRLVRDLHTDENIMEFLKHKKVKGINKNMQRDTLVSKLPIPTLEDMEIIKTLIHKHRPMLVYTPKVVKEGMERLERLGKV